MRAPALLLVALLAGCSTAARPPSLAPRAIEKSFATEPVAAPVAPAAPADASLATRIAALIDEADAGDRAFGAAERSGAAALAGVGAPTGSEAWLSAQQVIAALQAARQRTSSALAELDSLLVERAARAARDPAWGGLAEIGTARARVEEIVARQTERIEALSR